MICGITSPARFTCTQSPTRRSFSWMSSSLCSVASFTVVPPISTGSSIANGLSAPVRPTFTSIASSLVDRDVRRELARDRPARLASADDRRARPACAASRPSPRTPSMPKLSCARSVCSTSCANVDHLVERRAVPAMRLDRKAPARERVEQLALRREGKRDVRRRGDGEAEEAERALRGDRGIELAQRARGGVARIREDRLAGLRALLVQLLEAHRTADSTRRESRRSAAASSRPAAAECRAWCADSA